MSYILAPLTKVRDIPAFKNTMKSVEDAVIAAAARKWPGFTIGGLTPGRDQFVLNNIPPRHMSVPRGFGSWNFMQKFTSPGSWLNIFSYAVPRDQMHGFAGWAFIGPQQIFTAIRPSISDRILPAVDIEETEIYVPEGLAIIVKADRNQVVLAQELETFTLKGFQVRNTSGFNLRVVPIGIGAFKAVDDVTTLAAPAV